MKLILPIARMDILIIYEFQFHNGFSFINIQDYGYQNFGTLTKILLGFVSFCWDYIMKFQLCHLVITFLVQSSHSIPICIYYPLVALIVVLLEHYVPPHVHLVLLKHLCTLHMYV